MMIADCILSIYIILSKYAAGFFSFRVINHFFFQHSSYKLLSVF